VIRKLKKPGGRVQVTQRRQTLGVHRERRARHWQQACDFNHCNRARFTWMGEYLNAKFTAKRHAYSTERTRIVVPKGPPLAT